MKPIYFMILNGVEAGAEDAGEHGASRTSGSVFPYTVGPT